MSLIVSNIIQKHTEALIRDRYHVGAFSPWHLNNGWCFDVAKRVSSDLDDLGIEHRVLDDYWLVKDGPRERRPNGLHRLGTHEFIMVGGRYFDAECPHGVDSPYDIPMVQEAIGSARREREVIAFLMDDNAVGDFPCPEPMKIAARKTWEAYSAAGDVVSDYTKMALCVALQNILEPIKSFLHSADTERVAHVSARVLGSLGLECEVESGTAPEEFGIKGEHHWVRFEDGSVLEVALHMTPYFDGGRVGGQVMVTGPADTMTYSPTSAFSARRAAYGENRASF